MPVSTETDHEIVEHCAAVPITSHGANATHTGLTLLAQLHVETERVMRVTAKGTTEVVLLLPQVSHEIEARVGISDEQATLHVCGGRRV